MHLQCAYQIIAKSRWFYPLYSYAFFGKMQCSCVYAFQGKTEAESVRVQYCNGKKQPPTPPIVIPSMSATWGILQVPIWWFSRYSSRKKSLCTVCAGSFALNDFVTAEKNTIKTYNNLRNSWTCDRGRVEGGREGWRNDGTSIWMH